MQGSRSVPSISTLYRSSFLRQSVLSSFLYSYCTAWKRNIWKFKVLILKLIILKTQLAYFFLMDKTICLFIKNCDRDILLNIVKSTDSEYFILRCIKQCGIYWPCLPSFKYRSTILSPLVPSILSLQDLFFR